MKKKTIPVDDFTKEVEERLAEKIERRKRKRRELAQKNKELKRKKKNIENVENEKKLWERLNVPNKEVAAIKEKEKNNQKCLLLFQNR